MTTPQLLSLPWAATHRRRHSGAPGAPPDLQAGEIAINEQDTGGLTVWVGVGDDGNGYATSQLAIAGPGAIGALLTLFLSGLPTSPPSAAGWWNNGGVPTFYNGS